MMSDERSSGYFRKFKTESTVIRFWKGKAIEATNEITKFLFHFFRSQIGETKKIAAPLVKKKKLQHHKIESRGAGMSQKMLKFEASSCQVVFTIYFPSHHSLLWVGRYYWNKVIWKNPRIDPDKSMTAKWAWVTAVSEA